MSANRIVVSLSLTVLLLAPARSALADKYYVGPLNGIWNDPANWSDTLGGPGGAGVPGVGESALMVHADAFDRTLTLDVSASPGSVVIRNGGGGLNTFVQGSGVDLTTTTTSLAATEANSRSAYQQIGGTHTTSSLLIGQGNSSAKNHQATYTITDGTLSAGSIRVGGLYSVGTMLQDGGYVSVSNGLQLGVYPNEGHYTLNGGTLVTRTSEVGNSGKGTFIHSGGTHITSQLAISRSNTTSVGTYILNSASANLIVNGETRIADRDVGTFIQSAGTHVNRGMTVSQVGTGAYFLTGGSLTCLGEVAISRLRPGTFIQTGGTFIVGSPSEPQNLYTSKGYSAAATFEFSGADSTLIIYGNDYARLASQSSGNIVVGGSFYGGSCDMTGGSLTVGGSQFYGATFSQTGGVVTLTSPSVQMIYTNYLLGGGTFSAPTLRPSSSFVWSGGELDVSTLHLNGNVTVAHNSGKTLVIDQLTGPADYPGALDLTNNNMVIDYGGDPTGQITELRTFLQDGKVLSSTADSAHRLGYGDNADPLLNRSSFSGQTFPADDFSQLLIKYTFGGDANLDGEVNVIDLLALAIHWEATDAYWTQGDFDYDGLVNKSDLGILALNWQASEASLNAALDETGLSSVFIPEPTISFALFPVLLLRRRTREAPAASHS